MHPTAPSGLASPPILKAHVASCSKGSHVQEAYRYSCVPLRVDWIRRMGACTSMIQERMYSLVIVYWDGGHLEMRKTLVADLDLLRSRLMS